MTNCKSPGNFGKNITGMIPHISVCSLNLLIVDGKKLMSGWNNVKKSLKRSRESKAKSSPLFFLRFIFRQILYCVSWKNSHENWTSDLSQFSINQIRRSTINYEFDFKSRLSLILQSSTNNLYLTVEIISFTNFKDRNFCHF